jgi:hypothetical protein
MVLITIKGRNCVPIINSFTNTIPFLFKFPYKTADPVIFCTEFAINIRGNPDGFMLDLKKATYPELIDLLNAQTTSYIDMLRTQVPEEQFMRCKLQLKKIQHEIEKRVLKRDNSATPSNTTIPSSTSLTQQDSNIL